MTGSTASFWPAMPSQGCRARPWLRNWARASCACQAGMAKPRFCPWARMAVGMPITSPLRLTRAPPELPGLMAASVWIRPSRGPSMRSTALITPRVTVQEKPKGLPTATASWPGRSESSAAKAISRCRGLLAWSRARS